jgi:hypothetical protein
MKKICMIIIVCVSQHVLAQSVTITPSQGSFNTSSSNAVTLKSNASTSYMSFVPNGISKGYVGVLNNTNDVDFGTFVSNATGKINLVIKTKPQLTVNADGTVTVVDLASGSTRLLKVDNNGTLTTQPMSFVQNVSFAAFRPSAIEYSAPVSFTTNGDGTVFCTTGSAPLFAPVNLPDGATITKVEAYFFDNSSKDIEFELTRNGVLSSGYLAADFLSSITSSGVNAAAQRLEDTSITSAIVDNTNYFYFVRVFLPSGWDGNNLRVKGVVISYTY